MEYKEIKGDLLELSKQGWFDIICHGCNLQNNFGAGIAKQIKNIYPKAYEIDHKNHRLGDISFTTYENVVVVNCYTQIWYGKPSQKYFNVGVYKINRYDAIRNCLSKINNYFKGSHVGLPLIGCGLAGLEWGKVKKIIQEELKDCDVTVVHYDK